MDKLKLEALSVKSFVTSIQPEADKLRDVTDNSLCDYPMNKRDDYWATIQSSLIMGQ